MGETLGPRFPLKGCMIYVLGVALRQDAIVANKGLGRDSLQKIVIILLVTLTGWGADAMYVLKSEHLSANIGLESYCKPTMMVEVFVNKVSSEKKQSDL